MQIRISKGSLVILCPLPKFSIVISWGRRYDNFLTIHVCPVVLTVKHSALFSSYFAPSRYLHVFTSPFNCEQCIFVKRLWKGAIPVGKKISYYICTWEVDPIVQCLRDEDWWSVNSDTFFCIWNIFPFQLSRVCIQRTTVGWRTISFS
jgi:hypothetical protein